MSRIFSDAQLEATADSLATKLLDQHPSIKLSNSYQEIKMALELSLEQLADRDALKDLLTQRLAQLTQRRVHVVVYDVTVYADFFPRVAVL